MFRYRGLFDHVLCKARVELIVMAAPVLTALIPAALKPPCSTAAEKDGRPWWQQFLDRTGIDILVCLLRAWAPGSLRQRAISRFKRA
jgi:hypothetical protein